MKSLEKKDIIRDIRVIKPAICKIPGGKFARNEEKKFIIDEDNKILQMLNIDSNVVSNSTVWDSSVGTLEKRGIKHFVDPVNSYADDNFLVLHIVLLDAEIWDGESKLNLSIWVYNSYNQEFAFKFRFGTYRWVCTNGAVMGWKLLSAKHYRTDAMKRKIVTAEQLGKAVSFALQLYPNIQERINELRALTYTPAFKEAIIKTFGKQFKVFMGRTNKWDVTKSAYDLYLQLTWWVTHYFKENNIKYKERYYDKISKAFEL